MYLKVKNSNYNPFDEAWGYVDASAEGSASGTVEQRCSGAASGTKSIISNPTWIPGAYFGTSFVGVGMYLGLAFELDLPWSITCNGIVTFDIDGEVNDFDMYARGAVRIPSQISPLDHETCLYITLLWMAVQLDGSSYSYYYDFSDYSFSADASNLQIAATVEAKVGLRPILHLRMEACAGPFTGLLGTSVPPIK